MANVAVRHLALALPRSISAHGAQSRAEDALRCAGDDPRLLLVRRLSLGVLPSRAGEDWAGRTEAALRAQAGAAVHAGSPVASGRNAVFFADGLEARTLLMALLATGAWPSGWFWRLAVPEWDGAGWAGAAPRLLAGLVAQSGGTVALARVAVRSMVAGRLPEFVAPLTPTLVRGLLPPVFWAKAPAVFEPPRRAAGAVRHGRAARLGPATLVRDSDRSMAPPGESEPVMPQSEVPPQLRRMLAALPADAVRALWLAWAGQPPEDPVCLWLAAQIVLDASPSLAAAPSVLAAAARVLHHAVLEMRIREHASPSPTMPDIASTPATDAQPSITADRSKSGTVPHAVPGPHRLAEPAFAPQDHAEHRSEAAGLFLLVRPLLRLGLPEWLDAHSRETLDDFGWALLRSIVGRLRLPDDDPVWRLLPDMVADADMDALTAWRVGLDRWLRRRSGMGVSAVVRRPGWLTLSRDSTRVRFRLGAADIRLRRHALDVDPGWVPWLGHSVLFVFSDLPGGSGA